MRPLEMSGFDSIFNLLMDFMDIKGQFSDVLGPKRTFFVSLKVNFAQAWTSRLMVKKISGLPKKRDILFRIFLVLKFSDFRGASLIGRY